MLKISQTDPRLSDFVDQDIGSQPEGDELWRVASRIGDAIERVDGITSLARILPCDSTDVTEGLKNLRKRLEIINQSMAGYKP